MLRVLKTAVSVFEEHITSEKVKLQIFFSLLSEINGKVSFNITGSITQEFPQGYSLKTILIL